MEREEAAAPPLSPDKYGGDDGERRRGRRLETKCRWVPLRRTSLQMLPFQRKRHGKFKKCKL
jgi:hypothetical protein